MTVKRTTRLTALILSVLMVVYALPMKSLAQTEDIVRAVAETCEQMQEETAQEETESESAADAEAEVLGEDESLRTLTGKHYLLSDGSYIAVDYGEPVHFVNDEGTFADIDNTLVAENAKSDDDVDGYSNKANSMSVKFSKKLNGSGKLFSLNADGGSLSFSIVGANKTAEPEIGVSENETSYAESNSLFKATELSKVNSRIIYKDIFDGIDIEYILHGNGIKENIVVNRQKSSYSYEFEIKTKNFVAHQNSDGSISFADSEGKEKLVIPAPYMYDANGAFSDRVNYTLEQENNKYRLRISADSDWINADDRAFPVVIDPVLVQTKYGTQDNTDITTKYVAYGQSSQTLWGGLAYVGYSSSTDKTTRIYTKINNMPVIPSNCSVIKADIAYAQYGYDHCELSQITVEATAVTSDWNTGITWNSQPTNSGKVLDYKVLSSNTAGQYHTWDITSAVINWYRTPSANHGVVFKAREESIFKNSKCAWASLITYNNAGFYPNAQPKFIVQYRNNVGLEDYYTYLDIDVGRAGKAYVQHQTAQLTHVINDMQLDSTAFAFGIDHVYNSAWGGEIFTGGGAINTCDYTNMNCGAGWKLSIQETIVEKSFKDINGNDKTYLVHNDADGTDHYYEKESNGDNYVSEDGLPYKIVKNGDNFTMTDDENNSKYFHKGILCSVTDKSGNVLKLFYNTRDLEYGAWLPTGTDDRLCLAVLYPHYGSTNIIADFAYNSDGTLSTITDRYQNTVAFTYTAVGSVKYLTSIKRPDDTRSYFEYDSGGTQKMHCVYDGESRFGIQYSYNSGYVNTLYEYNYVSGIQERNMGAFYFVSRKNPNLTVVRYIGADGEINTDDDVRTYYLFDHFGHTVTTYSTDAFDKKLYGADCAVFNGDTNKKKNHKIDRFASSGQYSDNIKVNSGFENGSTGWSMYNGTENCALRISDEQHRTGNNAMKMWLGANAVGNDQAAFWLPMTEGKTYTFSAYVKIDSINGISDTNRYSGAYLKAYSASDGLNLNSSCVNQIVSGSIDGGWQRICLTFTAQSSSNYGFYLVFNDCQGVVYFDDVQLEEADAEGNYNIVQNGAFSSGSQYWSAVGSSVTAQSDEQHGVSACITGSPTAQSRLEQTVAVNLPAKTGFVLSGWAKADSVYTHLENSGRSFKLVGRIKYSDNTTEDTDIDFCSDITDWQYASAPVVPKKDLPILSFTVICSYDNNENTAYFDNISAVVEPVTTYKYDENGKLTAVNTTKKDEVTYTYDSANLLSSVATHSEGTYVYHRDAKKRVDKVTNGGVSMDITYDNAGNVTGTSLTGGGLTMTSSAVYGDNYNKLTSQTDSNNATTQYRYGPDGRILNVTDANGNVTNFRYDSAGRATLTYVTGIASVDNYYTRGNLTGITAGGYRGTDKLSETYSFTYDAFGSRTSTAIGSRILASYSYAERNGSITAMQYGNGGQYSYEYDSLDRVKTVKYNGTERLGYTYNGNGNVSSIVNYQTNTVQRFEYDSLGRVIRSSESTANGSTVNDILITEYNYDSSNRQTSYKYKCAGSTARSEGYSYNNTNGTLAYMYAGNGDRIDFVYDGLLRQSEKTVAHDNSTAYTFKAALEYKSAGTNTTSLVSGLTYSSDSGSDWQSFRYEYDALGNIVSVRNGANEYIARYTYDSQSRLVTEQDYTLSQTKYYEYDGLGNILSVKTCAGTDAEAPGSVISEKQYGYTDPEWRDLLTSYDGQSITYDQIGNPLSYRDSMSFTWTDGRRMSTASAGGHTLSFEYNGDGIRTAKTADGVKHDYITGNNRLLQETWGSNKIEYLYDDTGTIFSLYYNGVKFYLIKNLQGDVVELRNSTNGLVARYTYDAYGKCTSVKDSSGAEITDASNIALINPIRYRGYYFDSETGFYYVNSRYYDPEIGRWINADSAIAGVGGDVCGYNLFSFCMNNPVNMSDETGAWPKWIKNVVSAIKKAAKKVASVVTAAANAIKSSFSPANHVQKAHVTTPTAMLNLGTMFGKVGFSSTVTKQNKEPGLVHSASDIGNDASKYSAGINIVGWLGADVGVSSEINAFVSVQATPWVHGEVSFGLDGIGAVIGLDVGDTSYDFEINGGWGLIAIFVAPQIVASGGQPSGAPAY